MYICRNFSNIYLGIELLGSTVDMFLILTNAKFISPPTLFESFHCSTYILINPSTLGIVHMFDNFTSVNGISL